MSKKLTLKQLHIIILALGTAFILSCALGDAVWFDESYSVALVRLPFADMISAAIDDVHPLLYYIVLWLVARLPGGIVTLRVFSALLGAACAWLGYTHVRRDFGERVGVWYSVILFLLPCTLKYSTQIRMYSMSALFVTLCAVYAYRAYRDRSVRALVIMALFALGAAYTHHFALAAICFVNLFLFVALILSKDKKFLKRYLIAAAAQLLGFVPGALLLLHQISMGGAAGITVEWGRVLFDTLAFPFLGDMTENAAGSFWGYYPVLIAVGILFFGGTAAGLFLLARKKEKNSAPALLSFLLFFSVFAASLIVSLIKRPIYLERYTMVMYTLAVLPMAYVLGNIRLPRGEKLIKLSVTLCLLTVCVMRAVPAYTAAYSETNVTWRKWLDSRLADGDRIVFDEIGGFDLSIYHPEYDHYFFNKGEWDIEDAYKAFGNVTVVRDLSEFENYSGRVWVHLRGESYRILTEKYGFTETDSAEFTQKYYDYEFNMVLLER